MDERQIRAALEVAGCRSMSKAAGRLFMSTQGLKRMIDQLEQSELGCALFARTNKGVELTAAGEVFCREAPALLAQMESLAEHVRHARAGQLRISVWRGKDIPVLDGICAEYRRLYPDTPIVFVPTTPQRQIEDVEEGVADISFQSREAGLVDPSRLSYSQSGITMAYRCVLSPDSPLASRKAVGAADLAGLPVAFAGSYGDHWPAAVARHTGLSFSEVLPFERYEIMGFCAGGGVCICDEYLADSLAGFAVLPLEGVGPVDILIGHRGDGSAAVRHFIEVARAVTSG